MVIGKRIIRIPVFDIGSIAKPGIFETCKVEFSWQSIIRRVIVLCNSAQCKCNSAQCEQCKCCDPHIYTFQLLASTQASATARPSRPRDSLSSYRKTLHSPFSSMSIVEHSGGSFIINITIHAGSLQKSRGRLS